MSWPPPCEWCEAPDSEITVELKDGCTMGFCHTGCLTHWLYANAPQYFDEIFDAFE